MATRKQIEDLKERIAELEAQKKAIDEQLGQLHGERFAAEREFNRSEKLTPAMRTLLIRMAGGAIVKARTFHPYGYFWSTDEDSGTVRRSVYLGLLSREAITEQKSGSIWTREYGISDHGRNLVADNADVKSANAA